MKRYAKNSPFEKVVTILIVDDEFDLVTILKQGLERRGFRVFSFTDPFLALEHFKINAPNCDLVISDLRMPGMNGFEFLTKVRELRTDIKIFLMTAFEVSDMKSSLAISSLKINEFIVKPFSLQSLNMIIDKYVSLKNNTS
ncbi:MAG TPA: response regulator [Nitrososphaeraceae archaeon]|jgi:DNA-binding NtrC family response regulator